MSDEQLEIGDEGAKCTSSRVLNAALEPKSKMELLVNTTVAFADEDDRELIVCWRDPVRDQWRELETHYKNGSVTRTTIVQGAVDEDTGSRPAPNLAGTGDECCEGLRLGEVCLPTALVIVLWVLVLFLIGYLVFALVKGKKENDALSNQPKKGYQDFEMEDGNSGLVNDQRSSN